MKRFNKMLENGRDLAEIAEVLNLSEKSISRYLYATNYEPTTANPTRDLYLISKAFKMDLAEMEKICEKHGAPIEVSNYTLELFDLVLKNKKNLNPGVKHILKVCLYLIANKTGYRIPWIELGPQFRKKFCKQNRIDIERDFLPLCDLPNRDFSACKLFTCDETERWCEKIADDLFKDDPKAREYALKVARRARVDYLKKNCHEHIYPRGLALGVMYLIANSFFFDRHKGKDAFTRLLTEFGRGNVPTLIKYSRKILEALGDDYFDINKEKFL